MKDDSMKEQGVGKSPRWGLIVLVLLVQLLILVDAVRSSLPPREVREVQGYVPWPEEVVEAARALPVQDGGRVKPFSTYAGFLVLNWHGSRSIKIRDGQNTWKLEPTEILLDALFRPELARQLPLFRVEDTEVLGGLGMELPKRRDRLSYQQLEGGYDSLVARARDLELREKREGAEGLSREDKQLRDLVGKMLRFQGMLVALDFMRQPMVEEGVEGLPPVRGKALDFRRFSSWVKAYPQLGGILRASGLAEGRELPERVKVLFGKLEELMTKARYGPTWLAPNQEEEAWASYGQRIEQLMSAEVIDPEEWDHLSGELAGMEELGAQVGTPEFAGAFARWVEQKQEVARQRGEGEGISSEITYYQRQYFYRALVFFTLAFVIMALGWLAPRGWWGTGSYLLGSLIVLLGLAYATGGIVHRSVLMDRPPVGNLYDTIPFVTAVAVAVFLIAELVSRRRVMVAFAALAGMMGFFLAGRFEVAEARDHMDPLVAVLRSNYWLATHVVMITIGYSGGIMAGLLSHVYVHLRLAGVHGRDRKAQRFYTRAVYGLICFTLFFSLIGTVLGGIWANDSWGRFWGWDPKENGALLIVLWCLIILHGRAAGHLRHWGLHLTAIFGAIVVGFSWWGVNLLGVGLHNYGFIEGMGKIRNFYAVEMVAIGVGILAMLLDRRRQKLPEERAAA